MKKSKRFCYGEESDELTLGDIPANDTPVLFYPACL